MNEIVEDIKNESVIDEIKKEMENVPFGNSQFQIEKLNIGSQFGDARKYRQCLLEINNKLMAAEENKFREKRCEVDIEEIKAKLETETDLFQKKRLKIDLEEKESGLRNVVKLKNDLLYEVSTYYSILKKLPKFTREEFEKSELSHWQNTFISQAKAQINQSGAIQEGLAMSMQQLGMEPTNEQVVLKINKNIQEKSFLEHIQKENKDA